MNWTRFKENYLDFHDLYMSLDISYMNFPDNYLTDMEPFMQTAFANMQALEKGMIVNKDENRMVGHYWLRDPLLAPNLKIQKNIRSTIKKIFTFVKKIHNGQLQGFSGSFKNILLIGIGGSALGPQFVSNALGNLEKNKMSLYFFDNTDPDGMDIIFKSLKGQLGKTLSIVISKSGKTYETHNGMLEAEIAYQKAGLKFQEHAVAITEINSNLYKYAKKKKWLDQFPIWSWIGGRTSEFSSVGLLPAALQGINIKELLAGARKMDIETRKKNTKKNPAALLALMWYYATQGKGKKDMVILPYKDRLIILSKYLQQLVMESLGKKFDIKGNIVHQGISVYGNKGSTDQHAYVQQLREGLSNFFVTFIEVHKEREGFSSDINLESTSGEFLQGFLLGTREALHNNNRQSITISINYLCPQTIGSLIALWERAVGLYASLIGVNAYNQPGVEAGKKASLAILKLKNVIMSYIKNNEGKCYTVENLAKKVNAENKIDIVFKILEHMSCNTEKGIQKNIKKPFYKSTYYYKK